LSHVSNSPKSAFASCPEHLCRSAGRLANLYYQIVPQVIVIRMLCRKNKQYPTTSETPLRGYCGRLRPVSFLSEGTACLTGSVTGRHQSRDTNGTQDRRPFRCQGRAWPQEQWGFHAASFRLLIRVRAEVDGCGVLWALSSPSRKLISPPTKMTKPER